MRILLVEDEKILSKSIKMILERAEYEVDTAYDGEEALEYAKTAIYDLMILDVMMPKMDGFEVLEAIRQYSKVPVMMLTARSEERDELKGYKLGVDEYITKPFSPKILVARVEAVLRRTMGESEEKLVAGAIEIDKVARSVFIDEKPVDLSFKEYELLTYFIENKGIALSREKILNSVWNYDYFGDARTIDTHVKKLRAKMGDCGDYIKTIWGMGYKFEITP